jgi:hypothetical protein
MMCARASLQVEGEFHAQDAVALCDVNGTEFARGLVNFGSDDIKHVMVGEGTFWPVFYRLVGRFLHVEITTCSACGPLPMV